MVGLGFEAQTFMNDDGDFVTEVWQRDPPIAARIISHNGRFASGTLHRPWRFGLDVDRLVTLGSPVGQSLGIRAITAALVEAAG